MGYGGKVTAVSATRDQRQDPGGARAGYALLSPALVILLLGLAAPLILLGLYSLWSQDGFALNTQLTLAQYDDVWSRETYRALFFRSLGIAGIVTIVTLALAWPIAWFLAFHVTRGKFFWLLLLTLPFWTSYLLRIFSWKIILGYNGVINSALISLGLIDEPLSFLLYSPVSVAITLIHAWVPFAILPIYVSLEKMDRSLLHAAADLGDNALARLFRVVLPLSLPGVLSAAILIFVPTTGDYVAPAMVGGSDGIMVANIIQIHFMQTQNWPLGAALAVFNIAAVVTLALLLMSAIRIAVSRIR